MGSTVQPDYYNSSYDPRENPESLSALKRLFYEIEKTLNANNEHKIKLDSIDNKTANPRLSRKDLYRIYKSICKQKKLTPTIVYTGRDTLDREEIKKELDDQEKQLNDLEASV